MPFLRIRQTFRIFDGLYGFRQGDVALKHIPITFLTHADVTYLDHTICSAAKTSDLRTSIGIMLKYTCPRVIVHINVEGIVQSSGNIEFLNKRNIPYFISIAPSHDRNSLTGSGSPRVHLNLIHVIGVSLQTTFTMIPTSSNDI